MTETKIMITLIKIRSKELPPGLAFTMISMFYNGNYLHQWLNH